MKTEEEVIEIRKELLKRIPHDDTASLLRQVEAQRVLEGRLLERERCAKVAELVAEYVSGKFDSSTSYYIAELIRKGK